ncbi:MAG: M20/M25/M40 family metallo-hydrolase [Brumimicrobium sp.]
MNKILIIVFLFGSLLSLGQSDYQKDSLMLKKLFNESLENGKAYEDLRSLCKDVGARLTGSASAEMAVHWGKHRLESYDFDTVYLQEITVPHWVRGTKEEGWYKTNDNKLHKVNILALGGSIGTDGTMSGEIVMFENRDAIQSADRKEIEGKIVFISQPMDQKMINTFKAYGGCYPIRGYGAIDAAKKGAIGVVIRSLSLSEHDHAHTRTMNYEDDVKKIPAAAISTINATELEKTINESKTPVHFVFEMNCKKLPDVKSHNVIGEIKGKLKPDEIITVGGHLDSWDVGEGAHDDGAGIVHSMEAVRLLRTQNYNPKHTIRVVFFMNEENGNKGGKSYAKYSSDANEIHIAAIESDRGGFSPRGFSCDGSEKQIKMLQSFETLFKPYYIHDLSKGYGGVDISPLKDYHENIALFGFIPDSQRYYDFHHNHNDVFENVNRRELHLGAASIASLIYLLDNNL